MKKKMLITMCCICMSLLLMGASCSQSTVTPEQIKALAESVQAVEEKVDTYQAVVATIPPILTSVGIPAEKVAEIEAKLAKATEEIDRVQPQVAAIAEAVKNAPYSGGTDLQTILEAIRAGNAAAAPFFPYSGVVEGFLAIVGIGLGIFAKKKAAEATTAKTALAEVVMGGEEFKASTTLEEKKTFKDAMNNQQSESTKKMVAEIKA